MNKELTVYVLSDSIGETGELLTQAATSQFDIDKYHIKRFSFLSSRDQIEKIFEDQIERPAIIIYTIVIDELKDFVDNIGKEYKIPTVDLMTPSLNAIEEVMNQKPIRESGLNRRLDENYFKKVEAIEFAVKYDDGKDPSAIEKADIVLTGVSRTSKTPLSMYLAHKNYKVANIPLVPEAIVPKELFLKDSRRVIGLVADPIKLNEIRQERLKVLGLSENANYANLDRINEELIYSKEIMEKLACFVIDVSNKAIEETAGMIIDYLKGNFGRQE